MFSVGASPYNSLGRQIYGGWAATSTAADTEDTLKTAFEADPVRFFKDAKWASMAEKFSLNPADRELASHIRKGSAGILKKMRQEAAKGNMAAVQWVMGYNSAAGKVRNKYRLSSLSPSQKQTIFNRFTQDVHWTDDAGGLGDNYRMWLALANRAPFESMPLLPRGIGAVPDQAAFVLPNAQYALPAKLTAEEKLALAQARYGKAMEVGLGDEAAQALAYYTQRFNALRQIGVARDQASGLALRETQTRYPAFVLPQQ